MATEPEAGQKIQPRGTESLGFSVWVAVILSCKLKSRAGPVRANVAEGNMKAILAGFYGVLRYGVGCLYRACG